MSSIAAPPRIASAAAVLFGRHGDISHLAQQRGVCRQTLYREAHAVVGAVEGTQAELQQRQLQQRLTELQQQVAAFQKQLRQAVVLDAAKQAGFAATSQALGVSLSSAHVLLTFLLRDVLLADDPSAAIPLALATLGRRSRAAGRHAGDLLKVLDEYSHARATQVAADEIFTGRKPILMTIDQDSLCWLGGRLADNRDGPTWAQEFRPLTAAAQVTADGGLGMRKGLKQVNGERQSAGRPQILGQRDHFHALQRARRGVGEARHQAALALPRAVKAQKLYDKAGRAGIPRSAMQGRQLNQAWTKAEQAFDRWSAQEQAFQELRGALRLFTPQGDLATRPQVEPKVRALLAAQPGAEWARARRLLGPEAFTFLDRVQQQLAALPVAAALRQAALRIEGLRRRPEALRGEGLAARALRGLLVAATLVLALSGAAGQQALALVQGVLNGTWRSSSLVEGLNSVLRMQQARQKHLTQELLDLKRLYWNMQTFRAGKRKGTSPYGRQGLVLPKGEWWDVLKLTPEQLRQQLSQCNPSP